MVYLKWSNCSGRSRMLENNHNASPFPLEGGKVRMGVEGWNHRKVSFIPNLSTPIPAFPLQGGRRKAAVPE